MFATLLIATLSLGCASYPIRIDKLQTESQSRGVCVVHRIPLSRITVFRQEGKICIFPEAETYRAWLRNPNIVPLEMQKTASESALRPAKVSYCPACEKGFANAGEGAAGRLR
jgi:hypothetical protein